MYDQYKSVVWTVTQLGWSDKYMQVYDCVHGHGWQLSADKFQVFNGTQSQLQVDFFAIHGYKFIV